LPPGVVAPVVSQGCRPVGKPWTITASSGQMIQQLGGAPALDRLNEMVAELSTRDRLCASQGLHIGIVVNEQSTVFERGDFLIRGVLGADRENGWVAVGAEVAVGQTVQFQVRDAASAHEDLEHLLPDTALAAGALVFTCNGRGAHLFAEPSHDAALISEATTGGVAGMFCAGELGPIGQVNAVHGFTAMVLLFP
jgi:small ligand-binding sensory domain FIST